MAPEVKVTIVEDPIFESRTGKRGDPFTRLDRAHSTKGSEDDEDLM